MIMAYNDRKIVSILLEQCKNIEDRCPGYRKTMTDLVSEVLSMERSHLFSKTNISQKIGDQVNTAGKFLYKERKSNVAYQDKGAKEL